MVAVLLAVLASAGRLALTHRPSSARVGFRWWVHRRAVRSFVEAVAAGDMGAADGAARRVLRRHGPGSRARLRSSESRRCKPEGKAAWPNSIVCRPAPRCFGL